jgi:hypothetical protein
MFSEWWAQIKEFYSGFRPTDFLVILVVSDISQAFIIGALAGTITWWGLISMGFVWLWWHVHLKIVEHEIKNGLR